MEKNIYDLVVDELHETRKIVQTELREQFGRANPFRMVPVKEEDVLWIYENMAPEDMNYALETYGEEAVKWAYEMEQLRGKQNAR